MIRAATVTGPRTGSDLRTIWLMGAKTRILPEFIDGAVRDLLPHGATMVDLCAGIQQ